MNKYLIPGGLLAVVLVSGWFYFSSSDTGVAKGNAHAQMASTTEAQSAASSSASASIPNVYKNAVLGVSFTVPAGLSVEAEDHFRGDERSYGIFVKNADSTYYVRIFVNGIVEGTMGPGDVLPTEATSTGMIGGITAEKTVETYSDTGQIFLTYKVKSGSDWYYFDFPYTTGRDRAYSEAILESIRF